jgi:hypothetical protein
MKYSPLVCSLKKYQLIGYSAACAGMTRLPFVSSEDLSYVTIVEKFFSLFYVSPH